MARIYPKLDEYFKIENTLDNPKPEQRAIKQFFDYVKKPLKSRNSRIAGHFITRTTALSSFDWNIIGDSGNTERVIVRNKDLINKLISLHCYTSFFGASLYQLDLINNDYGTQLKIIKRYDNTEFDSDDNSIHYYDLNGKYTKSEQIGDNEFLLLDKISYLDRGGLMRSIMPVEIIRFDMILENANYLRKLKGILQIVDKGTTPETQANAEYAAKNAINHNYVITDDLLEFKLNQITAASGNSFKDFIDALNNEIAIAILGQANTSELPGFGGSRAALQVLRLISSDIMYSDMIRIENLVNRVLELDYKLNYGNGLMPYKFAFIIAQEQDIEKNASALQIANQFLDLKKDEAYKMLGLTPPTNNDEIIAAKKQLIL